MPGSPRGQPCPRAWSRSAACFATSSAERWLAADPTALIDAPRAARRLPGVLGEGAVAKLLRPPRRHAARPARCRDDRARRTRRACACPSSSRSPSPISTSTTASFASPARATRRGSCRSAPPRAPSSRATSPRIVPRALRDPAERAMFLTERGRPMTRQGFWKAAAGLCPARRRATRRRRRLAAQAAPLVRDSPRRARRGSARRASDARPCRHLDDRGLYAGQRARVIEQARKHPRAR